jgi:hypothetical protein
MKIFFSKLSTNGIAGFGGLNLFLVVILSEVTVQGVISIYRQGSSTLLVHLVLVIKQGMLSLMPTFLQNTETCMALHCHYYIIYLSKQI